MKIKITSKNNRLIDKVLELLTPILPMFKVKKSNNNPPYTCIYLTTKNQDSKLK